MAGRGGAEGEEEERGEEDSPDGHDSRKQRVNCSVYRQLSEN